MATFQDHMIHLILLNESSGYGALSYIPTELHPNSYQAALDAVEMRGKLTDSTPCWCKQSRSKDDWKLDHLMYCKIKKIKDCLVCSLIFNSIPTGRVLF